jgi:NAD(P)-dependent dehydrogenase (short-subunit alcohol dehydrogenase family)
MAQNYSTREAGTTRLQSKHCMVIGGANGIGRASALRLAREAGHVTVADIDASAASVVSDEIAKLGLDALAVGCDVTDEGRMNAAVSAAIERFGPLDALVVCAGVGGFAPTHEMPLDEWERTITLNLTGTFLSIKAALPSMLEAGRGSIVTFGSVSAVVAGAGLGSSNYSASKGGVLALTRSIAFEYAGAGLRANCLCPGGTATAFGSDSGEVAVDLNTRPSASGVRPPLERRASPEEIAGAVAFLVSEDSSYMTGAVLMVDGGYTAI